MAIHNEEKKSRGSILVDSCVIFDLGAEIPHTFQANGYDSDLRYLEILPALGRLGYKVKIPEAVVFETTNQVLAGNKLRSIRDFFTRSKEREERYGYWKEGKIRYQAALAEFMQLVAKHEFPNVEITPIGDLPGESADHVRAVKQVMMRHRMPNPRARHELITLAQNKPKDLADRVTARRVNQMLDDPDIDHPVVLLTNDTRFLESEFRKHMNDKNMQLVNITGLIAALNRTKMLSKLLPVKDDLDQEKIFEGFREYFSTSTDMKFNSTPKLVDSDCKAGVDAVMENDFAFMNGLIAIAQEQSDTATPTTEQVAYEEITADNDGQSSHGNNTRRGHGHFATVARSDSRQKSR